MSYKYKVYDHPSGRVEREDRVAAFVPGKDGTRFVTNAVVTGINKKSIRVRYYIVGKGYFEITLKDHQWCFIYKHNENIIDVADHEELLGERCLLSALYNEGVVEWEGWQKAVDKMEGKVGY